MSKNFPNLVKEKDTEVLEMQRVPNKLYSKSPTIKHIIVKIVKLKEKERILKVARKRQYMGAPIRLSSELSTETFQARRN